MKKISTNLSRSAFTLIELIIIFSILGILALVATYSFYNYVTVAKDADSASSIGAISFAMEIDSAGQEGAMRYVYDEERLEYVIARTGFSYEELENECYFVVMGTGEQDGKSDDNRYAVMTWGESTSTVAPGQPGLIVKGDPESVTYLSSLSWSKSDFDCANAGGSATSEASQPRGLLASMFGYTNVAFRNNRQIMCYNDSRIRVYPWHVSYYLSRGGYMGECAAQNIDGGWTSWSDWSSCSVRCGGGTQTRSRSCTNPSPAGSGLTCLGVNSESRACNSEACGADGADWSSWSDWSSCSAECNGGERSRSRSCECGSYEIDAGPIWNNSHAQSVCPSICSNASASWTGHWWTTVWGEMSVCQCQPSTCDQSFCAGEASQIESCNTESCPVDGGWSDWGEWSSCSSGCGGGTQSRARTCTNPSPTGGGAECTGDETESQACDAGPCAIDGGWSDWSDWSSCSAECGAGDKSRTRTCTDPTPEFGGLYCPGDDAEVQSCDAGPCPIDGGWSDWSEWSECDADCGTGTQARTRTCTNPSPVYGGSACVGDVTEEKSCDAGFCPVNGGWSDWGEWETCSVECGGGNQLRFRTCDNPSPEHEGLSCSGSDTDGQACNMQECDLDGGWSDWSEWSLCSAECGGGTQIRTKSCTNPTPSGNGAPCPEDEDAEVQVCNTQTCQPACNTGRYVYGCGGGLDTFINGANNGGFGTIQINAIITSEGVRRLYNE